MERVQFIITVVVAVAAGVVGGALFSGSNYAPVFTASEFRLVDEDGRTRASLHVTGDGHVRLVFEGEKAEGADEDAPPARLISLGVDAEGSAHFEMSDAAGRTRSRTGMNEKGEWAQALLAADGSVRVETALTSEDLPAVKLYDDGACRMTLSLSASHRPFVRLNDSAGAIRTALCLGEDDEPRLLFYSAEGTIRSAAGVGKGGLPYFDLFDKEGVVRRASLALSKFETAVFEMRDGKNRVHVEIKLPPEGVPEVGLYGQDGRPIRWGE